MLNLNLHDVHFDRFFDKDNRTTLDDCSEHMLYWSTIPDDNISIQHENLTTIVCTNNIGSSSPICKKQQRRRLCQVPGCSRVIKSQRLCQRHGAKTKLCKIKGCKRQAQGSFCGMCKCHYKEHAYSPVENHLRSYQNLVCSQTQQNQCFLALQNDGSADDPLMQAAIAMTVDTSYDIKAKVESIYDNIIPSTITWSYNSSICMPLASYLERGHSNDLPAGWHRNIERIAQKACPVFSLNAPFETWEIDLIWIEIGLLAGLSDTIFVHLAHAWGCEPGFHYGVARSVCETRASRKRKVTPDNDTTNIIESSATMTNDLHGSNTTLTNFVRIVTS